MELVKSTITQLVKEKVDSICDIKEWYTYPFVTDIEVTKERLENDEISDRELDICKSDFIAEIIDVVMQYVFTELNQPLSDENPNLEWIHDTVRNSILELMD